MELDNKDQIKIREYLLGKLSETDQLMLEERLLNDENLVQEFEVSKGEVVEEYYAATLSGEERRYLEHHLLASPEGRQRYELMLTLDRLKKRKAESPQTTLADRIQSFFRQNFWMARTAPASVAILIVVAVFLFRSGGQTVDGPTLASNMSNRQQGPLPTKVSIPSHASEMRFPLLLPSDMPANATYRAELDNKTDVTPVTVSAHDKNTVWVVISVKLLKRGEYSLKVVARTPDGQEHVVPGGYRFNIE